MADCANKYKSLLLSMGENSLNYKNLIKKWFHMTISKEEFDVEARKFLTTEQICLHNQLILAILNKCAGGTETVKDDTTSEKIISFFARHFEPINSAHMVDEGRLSLVEDCREFSINEGYLPDRGLVLTRLRHTSHERGLRAPTNTSVADLLVTATQHMMKNVLTAIVSRRKGGQIGPYRFLHSISSPVGNPWLCNAEIGSRKLEGLSIEDQIERDAAFKLAASDTPASILPISLIDVFVTLTVYPSIIASDYLNSVTKERIITRIEHPTYDD